MNELYFLIIYLYSNYRYLYEIDTFNSCTNSLGDFTLNCEWNYRLLKIEINLV